LVEVYKKEFYLQEIDQNKVITNSFEYLSSKVRRSEDFEFSSKNRLRAAKQLISVSPTVEKIKNLLRSHIPEKGALSICNHRPDGGGTESSHIIRINENNISWSFLIGFPCENDYATIQLFQQ
jgi:hypothetical protein